MFVNGKLLGKGPPPSAPWFHYYDEYDPGGCLSRGTNCISVIVYHVAAEPYGDADGRGRGGLLLEVTDAQNNPVVQSDETWRAQIADAWQKNTYHYGNAVAPFVESFDARREPAGWMKAGFNDRPWPAAGVIASQRSGSTSPPAAGPWSKLVPREIPFMAQKTLLPERVAHTEESVDLRLETTNLAPGLSMAGKPVRYTLCENAGNLCKEDGVSVFQSSLKHLNLDFGSLYAPAVVLDFGRIVTAHVKISLDGIAGGIIDIGYAERLLDGRFNICVDGAGIADRYIMKDGPQEFETFAWKAFRFLKLRFRSCPRPVKVRSVHAIISTYPYQELGRFQSDDQVLNGVFEISKATLRLCSNDFLMDTPWREKGQWLGDIALVTLPAIQSCFGDTALPRKFLLQAGQHQFPTGLMANVSNFNSMARWRTWTKAIPDYSLWWIGGVLDQFRYTGDETLLHRLYPQA
ncbi:MAG: family 78 glycoside hydrolase catalytic domain, partial [Kiritimatiellia bacterium]